jgi:sulfhydrogenase subunit beta (sulfur reductase)
MRYAKLAKADLPKLFQSLKSRGEVFAPVEEGGKVTFRKVGDLKEVKLEYTRTLLPPKKLLLPPEEEILRYEGEEYRESFEGKKAVLFGVHHCDVNGLLKLDRVFLDSPRDEYYARRRENTLVVGISCVPDRYCFCTSVGSGYATTGFDLFLHDLGREYLVRVGSGEGYRLSKEGYFQEAGKKEVEQAARMEERRMGKVRRRINLAGMGDLIETEGKEGWEEVSAKCLACGTCNLVCPTCQCYDVSDLLTLDVRKGSRVRRWDSCMLKRHALVAGGLNFRPTVVERTVNRLSCKVGEEVRCVGCGRCTVYCPAGIDFVEMLSAIRGEAR